MDDSKITILMMVQRSQRYIMKTIYKGLKMGSKKTQRLLMMEKNLKYITKIITRPKLKRI